MPLKAHCITLTLSPLVLPACIYCLKILNQFSMCQALPRGAKTRLGIQSNAHFGTEVGTAASVGYFPCQPRFGTVPGPDGNMWQNNRSERQWMYPWHQLWHILCGRHEPTQESLRGPVMLHRPSNWNIRWGQYFTDRLKCLQSKTMLT